MTSKYQEGDIGGFGGISRDISGFYVIKGLSVWISRNLEGVRGRVASEPNFGRSRNFANKPEPEPKNPGNSGLPDRNFRRNTSMRILCI